MEAKDTVMDGGRIYKIGIACNWAQGCGGAPIYVENLLKAQAEISFKAGYDEGMQAGDYYEGLVEGEHIGIREVVDRVSHIHSSTSNLKEIEKRIVAMLNEYHKKRDIDK